MSCPCFAPGALASRRSRFGRDPHRSGCITQNRPQLAQKRHTGGGPLHEHAAPIQWISLAANQVEFGQPIERTRDCRLGDAKLGGQAANRLRLGLSIACKENA